MHWRKSFVGLFFQRPLEILHRQCRNVRFDNIVVHPPRGATLGNRMPYIKDTSNLVARNAVQQLAQIPERRAHVSAARMIVVDRGQPALAIEGGQFLEL